MESNFMGVFRIEGPSKHLYLVSWLLSCVLGKSSWHYFNFLSSSSKLFWLYRWLSTVCPPIKTEGCGSHRHLSLVTVVLWCEWRVAWRGGDFSSHKFCFLVEPMYVQLYLFFLSLLLCPAHTSWNPHSVKHSWPITKNAQAGPKDVYMPLFTIGR